MGKGGWSIALTIFGGIVTAIGAIVGLSDDKDAAEEVARARVDELWKQDRDRYILLEEPTVLDAPIDDDNVIDVDLNE